MTGPRLRRLLVLLLVGAIVVRAVRRLRGGPTRTFDRPITPARLVPAHDPPPLPTVEPDAAPIEPTPDNAKAASVEAAGSPSWVSPVDGSCPDGYPVKANLRSGIFHLPGMSAYERTNPDRCYANAGGAVADGLRVAKR